MSVKEIVNGMQNMEPITTNYYLLRVKPTVGIAITIIEIFLNERPFFSLPSFTPIFVFHNYVSVTQLYNSSF